MASTNLFQILSVPMIIGYAGSVRRIQRVEPILSDTQLGVVNVFGNWFVRHFTSQKTRSTAIRNLCVIQRRRECSHRSLKLILDIHT